LEQYTNTIIGFEVLYDIRYYFITLIKGVGTEAGEQPNCLVPG